MKLFSSRAAAPAAAPAAALAAASAAAPAAAPPADQRLGFFCSNMESYSRVKLFSSRAAPPGGVAAPFAILPKNQKKCRKFRFISPTKILIS